MYNIWLQGRVGGRKRREGGEGRGKGMIAVIRIRAVCGMGFGIGDALRGRIQEALDAQGVRYDLEVVDESAVEWDADLVFTTAELTDRLPDDSVRVVAIQNFTNRAEVREKVAGALSEMGA